MAKPPLTRTQASAAAEPIGWRLLFGTFAASVAVPSLEHGLHIATLAASACGDHADDHLSVDVRSDRVELILKTARGWVTEADVQCARSITTAVLEAGLAVSAPTGGSGSSRPVQALELAIDALDIPAIRPFWKAVLAYVDEPGSDEPDAIVDPAGQGPSIWFQQMNAPRPQRNRIHFDIAVAHDEAPGRVRAAIDAGGTLVSAARAKAFWVLADAEGNEICVCTWQDRDG